MATLGSGSSGPRLRLVAYCRVSSSQQAIDGTIALQHEAVSEWAKKLGHRIVRWADDQAVSGGRAVEEREGLADTLSVLTDGKADGVVFTTLDRLARDLTTQEAALALFWRMGARVFTVDHGEVLADDPSDPMRTAMRQMAGVFAQLERGLIRMRMGQGRAAKAAKGGYIGGAPPFGKRPVNGELVDDADEQRVIATMRLLRSEGYSLQAIADSMNRTDTISKRGGHWSTVTVQRVLDPEARAKHAARVKKANARAKRLTGGGAASPAPASGRAARGA